MPIRPTVHLRELFQDQIKYARRHAEGVYPEECVGAIIDGEYVALENIHPEPNKSFRVDVPALIKRVGDGELQAIIHNHPDGAAEPSRRDMEAQAKWRIPFGIFTTQIKPEFNHSPVVWLDPSHQTDALEGRPFINGVWDCYSIIRDWYYQELGITLGDYPRDIEWFFNGENLYEENFQKEGFSEIPVNSEWQKGDVFLMKVYQKKNSDDLPLNHGAIYVGGDAILHHLPGRLSCIDTAGKWCSRYLGKVLRRSND